MELTADGLPRPVDVKSKDLHIRLAETPDEVQLAQRLRYQVFVEEMAVEPSEEMRQERREFDSYDSFCDHLLVFDNSPEAPANSVIATYRFMRREQALRAGQFYTQDEYDISPLLEYPGEVMELGRSCVHQDHRTGIGMQVLWRGIASYVMHFNVDLMFGCASLFGTDVDKLALPLSYLHHNHMAPEHLRPRALPQLHTPMDRVSADEIDAKAALMSLPPLIKGYLRLGGWVGDGAVVDSSFGTTDVCVVVKTDGVTEKYRKHLTRGESEPQTSSDEGR